MAKPCNYAITSSAWAGTFVLLFPINLNWEWVSKDLLQLMTRNTNILIYWKYLKAQCATFISIQNILQTMLMSLVWCLTWCHFLLIPAVTSDVESPNHQRSPFWATVDKLMLAYSTEQSLLITGQSWVDTRTMTRFLCSKVLGFLYAEASKFPEPWFPQISTGDNRIMTKVLMFQSSRVLCSSN